MFSYIPKDCCNFFCFSFWHPSHSLKSSKPFPSYSQNPLSSARIKQLKIAQQTLIKPLTPRSDEHLISLTISPLDQTLRSPKSRNCHWLKLWIVKLILLLDSLEKTENSGENMHLGSRAERVNLAVDWHPTQWGLVEEYGKLLGPSCKQRALSCSTTIKAG